jgi:hypothetical protein
LKTVVEYENGKPKIKRAETFCQFLGGKLPPSNKSFSLILSEISAEVLKEHPAVKTGALSNCRGDWYEWLIAISAHNYCINNVPTKRVLQLPNVSRFDVASLYKTKLFQYIGDLRLKVASSSGVSLITSNPDFVIIDVKDLFLPTLNTIELFDANEISSLEATYQGFVNLCDLDAIIGYLSVKTSLRPDRRLQLSHEGSLMKAIYVHLQTRDWIIEPKGLKYYAASTFISEADRDGLRTVATHSITNVQSKPIPAVDEVFQIDSINEVESVIEQMIK